MSVTYCVTQLEVVFSVYIRNRNSEDVYVQSMTSMDVYVKLSM